MKVAFNALNDVDTLTDKELKLLEPDEWVRIRKRRDFTKDSTAETKSLVWVSDDDAVAQQEAEGEEAPEREGGYRVDSGKLLIKQFEYMALAWNVYDKDEQGNRVQMDFTAANREKFVRLNGAALYAQMLLRGGGIAPDLSGKADPATGKPLTFQDQPEDVIGEGQPAPSPA